jgi:hypothetical protein
MEEMTKNCICCGKSVNYRIDVGMDLIVGTFFHEVVSKKLENNIKVRIHKKCLDKNYKLRRWPGL